jgi:type IV pilus assembly protein PilE
LLDNRGSYAANVSGLNVPTPMDVAALYTIAITLSGGPPPTFTASATPIVGKTQAADLGGAALTITSSGAKGPAGVW